MHGLFITHVYLHQQNLNYGKILILIGDNSWYWLYKYSVMFVHIAYCGVMDAINICQWCQGLTAVCSNCIVACTDNYLQYIPIFPTSATSFFTSKITPAPFMHSKPSTLTHFALQQFKSNTIACAKEGSVTMDTIAINKTCIIVYICL